MKQWAPRQHRPVRVDEAPPQPAPVRRRVRVGAADDRAEHQADQTAAQVLANLAAAESAGPALATRAAATRIQPTSTRATAAATATAAVHRRARVQRGAAIGAAGGEVDDATQADLDRSVGGGSPLDANVRRSMEGAFGSADFGGVRVHQGAESADLNDRLGAQAFTYGRDIYLGRGAPAMGTREGQGLMAHELAHTLQQGATARRQVRRLAYNKPITKVVAINVFTGGASGLVAEVSDGKKSVIVKANQANAADVIAADRLMRGGKVKSGKYQVKAPKSRLATPADVAELKAKIATPGVLTSPSPRDFATGLDGPHPALVAEAMEGEKFDDQQKRGAKKTVTTGDDGKKTATYDSDPATVHELTKLVKRTAPVKALAKSTAMDVAMGMKDRLIGMFNPENFLFDPKTKKFSFVDNTSSDYAGSLTSKVSTDGLENARSNFNIWARQGFVATLASDPAHLAETIVTNYTGLAPDGSPVTSNWGIAGAYRLMGKAAREDNVMNAVYGELCAVITANYQALVTAATQGLEQGRKTVLKLLAKPLPLTAGLDGPARLEAVTSLLARRAMIAGVTDPDTAWEAANVEARKLLGLKFAPAVPAFSAGAMKVALSQQSDTQTTTTTQTGS